MPSTQNAKLYLGATLVGGGGAEPDENGWVRPADWLPMPTVLSTDQKIVFLKAVFNDAAQYIRIKARAAYTVDWGDGSALENVADNVAAEHLYDYSAISNDTLSSLGYKQVLITIVPQSANNLANIDLSERHSAMTTIVQPDNGVLEVDLSMPNTATGAGSIILSGGSNTGQWSHGLERITLRNIGTNSVTLGNANGAIAFSSAARNLRSVIFDCNMNNVNSYRRMFALTAVGKNPANIDTGNAVTLSEMWTENNAITDVEITVPAVTCQGIFANCKRLRRVAGNFRLASVTTTMFSNCYSLSVFDALPPNITFSVANCPLPRSELVKIFTNLTDRTALTQQTITVTGCIGTADLTTADIEIATDKNWAVTT
jgi:hypothetical protein